MADEGNATTLRRVALLVGAALVAVWVVAFLVFLYVNVDDSYRHLGLLDTQVYRMGGRALLDGRDLYGVTYNWDALPFTYPPFAAIVFVPLATAGFSGGALVMTVASVAALARSLQLVVRSGPAGSRTRGWMLVAAGVATAVALWSIRSTFEYGQINLVVMWLVLEDLIGPTARRRWSGILLGLAIGLKLTPAVFLVLLVATKQYRKLGVSVATFAGTVLLGFVVQPGQAWTYWTAAVFDSSRVGVVQDPSNQSIAGLVARAVGRPSPIIWLLLAAMVLSGATVVASRLWRTDAAAAVVVIAVGGLLCSPISWAHHWVWLLPAVVVGLRQALAERRWGQDLVVLAVVVAGSIRIETLLSAGGVTWRSPVALDWIGADLYLVVAAWFLVTQARRVLGPGAISSPEPAEAPTAIARTR